MEQTRINALFMSLTRCFLAFAEFEVMEWHDQLSLLAKAGGGATDQNLYF
jgi:hypothetical protein